jgi:plasmid maintenance system killer protein
MAMITRGVMTSRDIPIDIEWADRRLAKACTTDDSGERRYGNERWALLRRRIAALVAAPTLADLTNAPGRCHGLRADRAGQFAMNLWDSYRLIFEPAAPITQMADGGIDRRAVITVRVIGIANDDD